MQRCAAQRKLGDSALGSEPRLHTASYCIDSAEDVFGALAAHLPVGRLFLGRLQHEVVVVDSRMLWAFFREEEKYVRLLENVPSMVGCSWNSVEIILAALVVCINALSNMCRYWAQ